MDCRPRNNWEGSSQSGASGGLRAEQSMEGMCDVTGWGIGHPGAVARAMQLGQNYVWWVGECLVRECCLVCGSYVSDVLDLCLAAD